MFLGNRPSYCLDVVQVGNEAARIPRALMDTEPDDELIFRPDLHVVGRFELAFVDMVLFHAHKGGIEIGLAKAVPIPQDGLIVSYFSRRGRLS